MTITETTEPACAPPSNILSFAMQDNNGSSNAVESANDNGAARLSRPLTKLEAYRKAAHFVAAILCGEHVIPDALVHATGVPWQATNMRVPTAATSRAILREDPTKEGALVTLAANGVLFTAAGLCAEIKVSKRAWADVICTPAADEMFAGTDASLEPFVGDGDARSLRHEIWAHGYDLLTQGQAWVAVCGVAEELLAEGERDIEGLARAILPEGLQPSWPTCPILTIWDYETEGAAADPGLHYVASDFTAEFR